MSKSKGIASIVLVIGVTIFCAAIGFVSSKYLGPDNAIEEAAEAEIKNETGIDVDLSP